MEIPVTTGSGQYTITLERGALNRVGEWLNLNRRVLIVTDTGVPPVYAETVAAACREPYTVTLPMGESAKCSDNWLRLLGELVAHGFTRTDCVVAVGGGVVGDLAGFAAACYMRGIPFYNIPTTLLSQVDSSIGGKTAIDFEGYKNIVGAFWPPAAVVIDPDTLKTLPYRQLACGLAEAVKMALTHDPVLFDLFENGDPTAQIDTVIARSLAIKKQVVEADEHEQGLRRVLNFGHTLAHAVENAAPQYLHGEAVAIGMPPMCAPAVRERLISVLDKLNLPHRLPVPAERLLAALEHDKKCDGDAISVVTVPEVGRFCIEKRSLNALKSDLLKGEPV